MHRDDIKNTPSCRRIKSHGSTKATDALIAGLKQIDKRARAVLIVLGDQPFVDSQTINSLVEAFIANKRGIIIPVYQGRKGNPVIFATKYKGELLNLERDVGDREIIKRHPDDVLEVAVNCEGVLLDIDTMENYTSTTTLNPYKSMRKDRYGER